LLAQLPAENARAGHLSGDRATTHAYLIAQETRLHEQLAYQGRDVNALRALARRLEAECPSLLSTPRPAARTTVGAARLEVAEEVLFAVLGSVEHTETAVFERFERVVRRLRWANGASTRLVHEVARKRAEQAAIAIPPVCDDLKAWQASGYATAPQDTQALLRRLSTTSTIMSRARPAGVPLSDEVEGAIAEILSRYETPIDRKLARRLRRLEARYSEQAAHLIVSVPLVRNTLTATPVKGYRVPSGSMEPMLSVGEHVWVEAGGAPGVAEIAVFYPPETAQQELCGEGHVVKPGGAACATPAPRPSGAKFVKRIVAGPGDELFMREGYVFRRATGQTTYAREPDSYVKPCGIAPECNFPTPIKVPPGDWYMVGDNRGESDDSRFWGPVPESWIVGIVQWCGAIAVRCPA
jgi:signal peptidase I